MNVYVLCSGERGEGHDPVSVHSTLAGAKSALRRHLPGSIVQPRESGQWMATENRTDEWWIHKLVVDGGPA